MNCADFDTIARTLGSAANRRLVVRTLIGAVVGSSGFGLGRSGTGARKREKARRDRQQVRQEAAGRGNNACAHFCNSVLPPGRQRGQCKSTGARHVPGNLCDACETDVNRFCDGVCCAAGEACEGGICQGTCGGNACTEDECCDGAACQPGGTWQQCRGGDSFCETCAVEAACAADGRGCQACATQTGSTACDGVVGPDVPRPEIQCGPGDTFFCTCAERGDGEGGACIGNVLGCSRIQPTCSTDADCETLFPESGWLCVRKGSCDGVEGCIGDTICASPCDTTADAAQRRADARPRIVFAD